MLFSTFVGVVMVLYMNSSSCLKLDFVIFRNKVVIVSLHFNDAGRSLGMATILSFNHNIYCLKKWTVWRSFDEPVKVILIVSWSCSGTFFGFVGSSLVL